jgi:hypothetical protein
VTKLNGPPPVSLYFFTLGGNAGECVDETRQQNLGDPSTSRSSGGSGFEQVFQPHLSPAEFSIANLYQREHVNNNRARIIILCHSIFGIAWHQDIHTVDENDAAV